ncbi:MAG: response regulator transcription factor [Wolinella sp.]
MRIMLLEDETGIVLAIERYLKKREFEVRSFSRLSEALDALEERKDFDLFIVDIMLPDGNGISFIEHLRTILFAPKVIVISADSRIQTIERAFLNGCEDYLKKPFDIRELGIKIDKIFGQLTQEITLREGIVYEKVKRMLYINKTRCHLSPKETILLDVLVQNLGRTVTKEALESAIWEGKMPSDDALRTAIKRVRQKIGEGVIKNIVGVGYQISLP